MQTSKEAITIWFVNCRTGCSCCSYENHYDGPFLSKEQAEARVVANRENKHLASQFAPNGVYTVVECKAENLNDGRLIVWGAVIDQVPKCQPSSFGA